MNKETLKEYLCWLIDNNYIKISNIHCMGGIFVKYKNKYIFEKREQKLNDILK